MTYKTRKSFAFVKTESTYGTDSISAKLAAGTGNFDDDVVFLAAPPAISVDGDDNPSETLKGGFERGPGGGKSGKVASVTLECELRGSNSKPASDTDPPTFAPLWLASGMVAGTPSDTTEYTPDSDSTDSVTIYLYQDGIWQIITGARGTFTITGEAGARAMISFEMQGIYNTPTTVAAGDITIIEAITDGEASPIVMKGCSLSFGGESASDIIASSFEFSLGNTLEVTKDLNSSDAVKSIDITGREPVATASVEMLPLATWNAWSYAAASTAAALSITFGDTDNNQFILSLPSAELQNMPSQSDSSGRWFYDLNWLAVSSTKDGDVSLTIS